jgi:hypothetical protein
MKITWVALGFRRMRVVTNGWFAPHRWEPVHYQAGLVPSWEIPVHNCNRRAQIFLAVLSYLTFAASAVADDGNVLPAHAEPHGYSLLKIAKLTAVYNTGQMTGNPLTPKPPKVPFHILVANATVSADTMFYLPVYVADDSGSAPAGFPKNVDNQRADGAFLDQLVYNLYGVTALIVQVDGKTTTLSPEYVVGTKTRPLLDGSPAGTHYIVSAAFLSPLSPGEHTVGIGGIIDGAPTVFASYSVNVVH